MKNMPGSWDIGPEFDRLKSIREISLNEDLVVFVEKSYSKPDTVEARHLRVKSSWVIGWMGYF